MHLQSKSKEEKVESNPIFIPKRVQNQSKHSFAVNGSYNKFRQKDISVNGSVLPITFNSKTINPLNSLKNNSISVKAEVHQQIPQHLPTDRMTNTNRLELVDNKSQIYTETKMTAIKSILKSSKCSDSAANGVIRTNRFDKKEVTNEKNFLGHKTHNQAMNNNMKSLSSTQTRRKSSSVQFDIHDIKESTRVQLNTNSRGLTSLSSARRESSNSSSSLSIIQQSVPANPVLTYDFPKSSQRMSDLRKILNPEIEKEDSLKKLGERLIHCDCFELNLNNAAKIITALVFLATIILVLRALYILM